MNICKLCRYVDVKRLRTAAVWNVVRTLTLDAWCIYCLMYVARTVFINSNYLSIILYRFILMSCRPRPVRCTSHINTRARNYLVFNVDNYIMYLIVYVDCNKTLYLSYDDLWFVFKNDYRTRIILCILFTTAARVMCDYIIQMTQTSDAAYRRRVPVYNYICI